MKPYNGPEIDEQRWALVEDALRSPLTETAKLIAIGTVVQSRKLYTEADIERTRQLSEQFGWEVAPPTDQEAS